MNTQVNIFRFNDPSPRPNLYHHSQLIFSVPELFAWWEIAADLDALPIPLGRGGYHILCTSLLMPGALFNDNYLFFRFSQNAKAAEQLFSWFSRMLKEHPLEGGD